MSIIGYVPTLEVSFTFTDNSGTATQWGYQFVAYIQKNGTTSKQRVPQGRINASSLTNGSTQIIRFPAVTPGTNVDGFVALADAQGNETPAVALFTNYAIPQVQSGSPVGPIWGRLHHLPIATDPTNGTWDGGNNTFARNVHHPDFTGTVQSGGGIDFSYNKHINKNQDYIGDGSTYSRIRGNQLLGGALARGSVGKNLLPNPSFELNENGTSTSVALNVNQPVSNGWFVHSKSASHTVWLDNTSGYPHSGSQCVLLRILAGSTIAANSVVESRVFSAAFPVKAGDSFKVSGWIRSDNSLGTLPSGIAIGQRIGLFVTDNANSASIELMCVDTTITTGTGAWTQYTTTLTIPSTVATGKYPAFAFLQMCSFLENSSAASVTLPATGSFDLRFDDLEWVNIQNLDNEVTDGTQYGRPLLTRLSSGKPLIDFSESIHLNKTIDNVGDGSTYARVKSTALTSGQVDLSQAGVINKVASNITYTGGSTVDSLKPAESGAEKTTGKSLDILVDGSTYGRPLLSRLSSGKPLIDFSESIHLNKTMDNVGDGSTYARIKSSALSSGILNLPTGVTGILSRDNTHSSFTNLIDPSSNIYNTTINGLYLTPSGEMIVPQNGAYFSASNIYFGAGADSGFYGSLRFKVNTAGLHSAYAFNFHFGSNGSHTGVTNGYSAAFNTDASGNTVLNLYKLTNGTATALGSAQSIGLGMGDGNFHSVRMWANVVGGKITIYVSFDGQLFAPYTDSTSIYTSGQWGVSNNSADSVYILQDVEVQVAAHLHYAMPYSVKQIVSHDADAYSSYLQPGQIHGGNVFIPGGTGSHNYVANPTFWNGISGWSVIAGSISTDQYGGGRAHVSQIANTITGFQQLITGLVSGQAMVVQCIVEIGGSAVPSGTSVFLRITDQAGTYLTNATPVDSSYAPNRYFRSTTFTAPSSGQIYVQAFVSNGGSTNSADIIFYRFQLEYGSKPTYWVDHLATSNHNKIYGANANLLNTTSLVKGTPNALPNIVKDVSIQYSSTTTSISIWAMNAAATGNPSWTPPDSSAVISPTNGGSSGAPLATWTNLNSSTAYYPVVYYHIDSNTWTTALYGSPPTDAQLAPALADGPILCAQASASTSSKILPNGSSGGYIGTGGGGSPRQ